MKRTTFLVLAVIGVAFLGATFVLGESKDDIQAIRKAVKENPNYEPGKEVKWFKVLVTDTRTNKDKVRITLPLSLVEVFVKCADDKHLRIHDHDCDIDFEELLAELKKVGPMAFIEVYEDDEIVKVWLE
jgi:hypothetical protein